MRHTHMFLQKTLFNLLRCVLRVTLYEPELSLFFLVQKCYNSSSFFVSVQVQVFIIMIEEKNKFSQASMKQ